MLKKYGIKHQVLNAKFHESEAEIVAQAGRKGMVTIATNMAGRGTDIILGGNPEFMAWADLKRLNDADNRPLYPTRLEVPKEVWEGTVVNYEPAMKAEGREVAGVGGLHIIGTERHDQAGGSTTSCVVERDGKETRVRRGSSSRSKTT